MRLILDATDTTSKSFVAYGGIVYAHCVDHAGGTWTLQIRWPAEDSWTDADDVQFTQDDILRFYTPASAKFRFTGGTAGARIYVQGPRVLDE